MNAKYETMNELPRVPSRLRVLLILCARIGFNP